MYWRCGTDGKGVFIAVVVFLCLEVTFYSLIKFQDKNKFKCTNEAAIGKSLEIVINDNL